MEQAEVAKAEAVVDRLFGDIGESYTLSEGKHKGKVITFRTAKLKEIGSITRLLSELASRIPRDKFAELIGTISGAQVEFLSSGGSKEALEKATTDTVRKLLGDSNTILMAIAACMDVLPRLMGVFVDVSQDVIDEMELDDAVMVVMGIVSLNYAFFTQRFVPLAVSALGALQKKPADSQPSNVGKLVQTDPVPTPA